MEEEKLEEQLHENGEEAEKNAKKGFFARLKEGLAKTRDSIFEGIGNVFSYSKIDDEFYEDLEETLIMADVGLSTTETVIESLKKKVKEKGIKNPEDCRELLAESLAEQMQTSEDAYDFEEKKSVVILIGVNGVGKTTTAGKLASQYKARGKKVILAAADTFRAAAIEQLTEWAHRSDVPIIAQKEGSDPAAVVFDAIGAAKARKGDILICDTAGRLHNKKNLMNELEKMFRVINREYPDAQVETLVVVDAATGQNAKEQAKQFSEITDINGIILTKLDGSAKGGIAIAIQSELGIPVKYIGVGEKIEDLQKFDSRAFIDALLDVKREEEEALLPEISEENSEEAAETIEENIVETAKESFLENIGDEEDTKVSAEETDTDRTEAFDEEVNNAKTNLYNEAKEKSTENTKFENEVELSAGFISDIPESDNEPSNLDTEGQAADNVLNQTEESDTFDDFKWETESDDKNEESEEEKPAKKKHWWNFFG